MSAKPKQSVSPRALDEVAREIIETEYRIWRHLAGLDVTRQQFRESQTKKETLWCEYHKIKECCDGE